MKKSSNCRAGVSRVYHQLEYRVDRPPWQSTVCIVEPHCWRLSLGLCNAGHLGRLRHRQHAPTGARRQSERRSHDVSWVTMAWCILVLFTELFWFWSRSKENFFSRKCAVGHIEICASYETMVKLKLSTTCLTALVFWQCGINVEALQI